MIPFPKTFSCFLLTALAGALNTAGAESSAALVNALPAGPVLQQRSTAQRQWRPDAQESPA